MKYKKMLLKLQGRQKWYESQSESYKRACKRPGSVKK